MKSIDIFADNSKTEGFTETEKFAILCCGNILGNNNKFYCLEVQHNPATGQYRLLSNYGRVGSSSVWEERKGEYTDVTKDYEKIIKHKLAGKNKKKEDGTTYREKYEEINTPSPSVGSANIRKSSNTITKIEKAPSPSIDFDKASEGDSKVATILRWIWEENIHNITTSTSIKYSVNDGFSTALGPLTLDHISRAKIILDEINEDCLAGQRDAKVCLALQSQYISLVPRVAYGKVAALTAEQVAQEFDLLEQLKSAITIIDDKDSGDKSDAQRLAFKLSRCTEEEVQNVSNRFEKSRAHNHNNLLSWKVNRVYNVDASSNTTSAKQAAFSTLVPIELLWHGSKPCNALSILTNGLIIPPKNHATYTGRMYGDGVYAAPNGTKALNYATDFWNKSNNSAIKNKTFLFVVEFALGKVHNPSSTISRCPSGFHSVWAKRASAGLYNDEVIVYNANQVRIKQLVEMKNS